MTLRTNLFTVLSFMCMNVCYVMGAEASSNLRAYMFAPQITFLDKMANFLDSNDRQDIGSLVRASRGECEGLTTLYLYCSRLSDEPYTYNADGFIKERDDFDFFGRASTLLMSKQPSNLTKEEKGIVERFIAHVLFFQSRWSDRGAFSINNAYQADNPFLIDLEKVFEDTKGRKIKKIFEMRDYVLLAPMAISRLKAVIRPGLLVFFGYRSLMGGGHVVGIYQSMKDNRIYFYNSNDSRPMILESLENLDGKINLLLHEMTCSSSIDVFTRNLRIVSIDAYVCEKSEDIERVTTTLEFPDPKLTADEKRQLISEVTTIHGDRNILQWLSGENFFLISQLKKNLGKTLDMTPNRINDLGSLSFLQSAESMDHFDPFLVRTLSDQTENSPYTWSTQDTLLHKISLFLSYRSKKSVEDGDQRSSDNYQEMARFLSDREGQNEGLTTLYLYCSRLSDEPYTYNADESIKERDDFDFFGRAYTALLSKKPEDLTFEETKMIERFIGHMLFFQPRWATEKERTQPLSISTAYRDLWNTNLENIFEDTQGRRMKNVLRFEDRVILKNMLLPRLMSVIRPGLLVFLGCRSPITGGYIFGFYQNKRDRQIWFYDPNTWNGPKKIKSKEELENTINRTILSYPRSTLLSVFAYHFSIISIDVYVCEKPEDENDIQRNLSFPDLNLTEEEKKQLCDEVKKKNILVHLRQDHDHAINSVLFESALEKTLDVPLNQINPFAQLESQGSLGAASAAHAEDF